MISRAESGGVPGVHQVEGQVEREILTTHILLGLLVGLIGSYPT